MTATKTTEPVESVAPEARALRTALVTGSGRGLGRAIARALADEGFAVGVNDKDVRMVAEATAEMSLRGARALGLPGAVDDEADVDAMLGQVAEAFGRLDTLVCNAGMPSSGHGISSTSGEEVLEHFRVQALGSFTVVQRALPLLRESGNGLVIFMSSAAAAAFPPRALPYAMAKAALEALAWTLANEERGHGIRVGVLSPGMFDTRLGREVKDRMAKKGLVPQDHPMLDPDDLAEVVRFLTTPAGRLLTTQRLTLDAV